MEELLTVEEVAQKLKLNQQTVRNWIDAGTLNAVRIGRRVRVKVSDLNVLLEIDDPEQAVAPVKQPPLPNPIPPDPPELRKPTALEIRTIENVVDTMLVTAAAMPDGSPLGRELGECSGRLQVALRRRE